MDADGIALPIDECQWVAYHGPMAMKTAVERERGVCCAPRRRMRPERVGRLTDVLKALADPTRLEVVAILRDSATPVCVCDLTAAFDLSQPTLSFHMGKLREAGLIEARKGGIWTFYSLRRGLEPEVARLVEAIAPA